MLCLIRRLFKVIREFLEPEKFFKVLIFFLLVLIFVICPISTEAMLEVYEVSDGHKAERSLESLRDLDYQTWQLVAYPKFDKSNQMILRIVGFQGSLRIDHPTKLEIHSGIKSWELEDVTFSNPQLADDNRDAVAEFCLDDLLKDLKNNRPLRLYLDGGFTELPVPPYVVNEWRSINSTLS